MSALAIAGLRLTPLGPPIFLNADRDVEALIDCAVENLVDDSWGDGEAVCDAIADLFPNHEVYVETDGPWIYLVVEGDTLDLDFELEVHADGEVVVG